MSDFDWQGTFWAVVIFVLTWLGDFAKALHVEAKGGEKANRSRILRALPSVLIISAAAIVAGNYLHGLGYSMLAGGVIGGFGAYIGLEAVSVYAQSWLEKLKPGKDKGGD